MGSSAFGFNPTGRPKATSLGTLDVPATEEGEREDRIEMEVGVPGGGADLASTEAGAGEDPAVTVAGAAEAVEGSEAAGVEEGVCDAMLQLLLAALWWWLRRLLPSCCCGGQALTCSPKKKTKHKTHSHTHTLLLYCTVRYCARVNNRKQKRFL